MELLRTKRLLFRTHEARDEAAFVAMHTDAEVRRYVGGYAWSEEKARERFHAGHFGRPTDTYGLWATVLIEEDQYIGECGLTKASSHPQLAYYIARPYWGRGLATEAAAAFVAVAKERLALEALYADVSTGHAASERVLCKFGFKRTGHTFYAQSGRDISHYRLALL